MSENQTPSPVQVPDPRGPDAAQADMLRAAIWRALAELSNDRAEDAFKTLTVAYQGSEQSDHLRLAIDRAVEPPWNPRTGTFQSNPELGNDDPEWGQLAFGGRDANGNWIDGREDPNEFVEISDEVREKIRENDELER